MHHLALRPQPLGIFPLPAGYLVLPAVPDAEAALAELLQGRVPTTLPAAWHFFALAVQGDHDAARNALAGDPSPEARYNWFVLTGDPAVYAQLATECTGDLTVLLDLVAYTLGLRDLPPDPDLVQAEVRASALMARAAYTLEQGQPEAAEAELDAAINAAQPVSPLLAAQLRLTLADTRLSQFGPDPLAIQHYREAIRLLSGSGLTENHAHANLNLGMLYQELARSQRGPLLEAAKCYQAALRTFTRASHPELYALAQNNLALAYLAMPLTEASDQLRMGIAVQALREALTVYTQADYPEYWASAQLNLANALQYLPSAHPADNLAEAVQLYEALLAVRDPETDPLAYGRVLANQGNALAHLGIFTHARPKLQEAARLFAANGDHEAAASVRELLSEIERSVAAQKEEQRDGGVPAPTV
ncbi:MAG: hypothetical protein AB4911_22080 [Oscillochloridaceae bacterium umkhey_bin13]